MSATFTPYDGWERDVELACLFIRNGTTTNLSPMERAERLLAAFSRPKCGAILYASSRGAVSNPFRINGEVICCNLPKGHHPFTGTADDRVACCGDMPGDLVHSPGHVGDIPEGFWA